MKQNNSPWLTQLNHARTSLILEGNHRTDVVIIGAGIAGVTTLYYLLKHTDKKVILVEGDKIAHGATGHNAGQVVAEFERPLTELIKEYGMKKAIEGLQMVENSWELLVEILEDTNMKIPFQECIGYGGFAELEPLLEDLETELIKFKQGLMSFPVFVSRESGWMKKIPEKFHDVCIEIDASELDRTLSVSQNGFYAALPHRVAVVNSALFTEKLAMWCVDHYPGRVQLFEHSFVHGIDLASDMAKIITNQAEILCDEVVVCTNGFENFYIHDKAGMEIDTKFHHLVQGIVGYMTGYLTNQKLDPMANYYYDPAQSNGPLPDPYYYVTRRKFGTEESPNYLMAIGGPEVHLVEREIYFREFEVANKFRDNAVAFTEKHFDMSGFDEKFFWHGLMGYTRSGVRMVGREPLDPRLMYNLGCNGVGILPSIMGARKIARHIAGENVPETIFDPRR